MCIDMNNDLLLAGAGAITYNVMGKVCKTKQYKGIAETPKCALAAVPVLFNTNIWAKQVLQRGNSLSRSITPVLYPLPAMQGEVLRGHQ